MQELPADKVAGDGRPALGTAPSGENEDWVVLVRE